MAKLEFVSTATAAQELDLAVRTIQEWCKQKKIKAFKMGHDWRIQKDDWETFKKRLMSEAS